MKMYKIIRETIEEHKNVADSLYNNNELLFNIEKVATIITEVLSNNGKVILFGNGGSASDAQHIAAEFTGRFEKERQGLSAIALNTDTSALTAISNDFGFSHVYERQLEALANKSDLCIGISTSGNSENVTIALKKAKEIGCYTVGLLGKDGGTINTIVDKSLIVKSKQTARIQEMHILIAHIICSLIDNNY